jgi:cytosol alanyl aminopeptidase
MLAHDCNSRAGVPVSPRRGRVDAIAPLWQRGETVRVERARPRILRDSRPMNRWACALTVVLLAAGCRRPAPAPEAKPTAVPPPRADGRLPRQVRPTRYALELTVDPAQPRFSGRARVSVAIDEPVSAIVMNARGLTVGSAALVTGGQRLPATTTLRLAAGSKQDPEELVLAFDRVIPAGAAEVEIDYDGAFASGLRGLYRVQEGGRWYAFTQFEPTDARRAFPGFDEPGYKTPFAVSVTVPAGSIALANMREVRRETRGTQVKFEFEPSPPLPTYLVAIAVGAFDMREALAGTLAMRLAAVSGKAGLGAGALAAARGELLELERYFGRPFPYPKLDLLAVPSFGAGAMENAGLMTFREERILLDDRAALASRIGMANIIAHEEAHQWFGDLVTMAWWDDLWLNEAFASFMADEIVDAWRPATRSRLQALANKSQVMADDSLATARRIRQPVRSTSEAQEAFDSVTYAKGRAVLAMTEAWLGPDAFRAGLRGYLQRHEWGNATADDLYAALTAASGGRDVAGVMRSFTDQVGVPIVEARVSCPPGRAATVTLRQEEYRTLERRVEGGGALWRIPVCVAAVIPAGKEVRLEKRCTVLATREATLDLDGKDACPAFVYANAGETGYYRVRIGAEDLKVLAPFLAQLPERERFGVVSNAWAAVRAGRLAVALFFNLCLKMKDDPSRLVWTEMLDALRAIDRSMITVADRPLFARFIRTLCEPAARRLGWQVTETQPDDERFLREAILHALGDLGEDPATLAMATRQARAWLDSPAKVSPDVARIALPLAAKRGDAALFDRLFGVVTNPPTPEARVLALSGLVSFDDPALIERTLGLVLAGKIKAQDLRYLFPTIGLRRAGRDIVNAWIERHFDELARMFPTFLLGRIVRAVPALCDEQRVRAADASLRPRAAKLEGVEKDLRQSVEEGLRCAALARAEGGDAAHWLRTRLP